MAVEILHYFHTDTSTYSYLVWDPDSLVAAIIDPVLDYDAAAAATSQESADHLLAAIAARDLKVQWILETHAHADHLSAAKVLQESLPGSQIAIGKGITLVQQRFKTIFNLEKEFPADGSQFDRLLEEGDTLPLGTLEIRAISTPGHTSDSLTYLIEDAAFVGDSIFMPDMGTARVDFPAGDANTLYDSIQKLFELPDETRLFMCHDYAPGGREHRNQTTVAEEKAGNIHVGSDKSRETFVSLRQERDATLGAPRLLYPAVQINIRGGQLPPPDSNGIAYVRIPLNSFKS